MVEVTDEDRQAAAAFYETWGGKGWAYLAEPICEGDVDDNFLIQAFARHRIAAEQRGKLEGARLAIEAAAKVCAKGGYVNPEYGVNNHPASDAIRALSPAKIVGEG